MTTISLTPKSIFVSASNQRFPRLSDNTAARVIVDEFKSVPVVGRIPSQDVFAEEAGYFHGLSRSVLK